MAMSASVGNLLRLSQTGGNLREAFDQRRPLQQGESSTRSVCASRGRCSIRLVTGGRLGWRRQRGRQERVLVLRASDNNRSNQSGETGTTSSEVDVEALEARLGVGRRARTKQQGEEGDPQSKPAKPKQPVKKWESMSLAEKAWTLYIDPERGVLFWINKLAYAAIFAVIGGWIIFRFIGPALGWYQLDQPLLSPERLLDGP